MGTSVGASTLGSVVFGAGSTAVSSPIMGVGNSKIFGGSYTPSAFGRDMVYSIGTAAIFGLGTGLYNNFTFKVEPVDVAPLDVVGTTELPTPSETITASQGQNLSISADGVPYFQSTDGAGNLDEVTFTGRKLTGSEKASLSSLRENVAEHEQKLINYINNPNAFDNKGFLKNAPNEEIRQRIIQGRVRHLNNEISTFKNQIEMILNGK